VGFQSAPIGTPSPGKFRRQTKGLFLIGAGSHFNADLQPRRQIDFACCLGRGREACHRPGTAGRIHHRHGQLDDVFPVVPEPADTASGGFDDLAARWSGLPGGAGIGDRQRLRPAYCGFSRGRWRVRRRLRTPPPYRRGTWESVGRADLHGTRDARTRSSSQKPDEGRTPKNRSPVARDY
jgi:hypothetical protein